MRKRKRNKRVAGKTRTRTVIRYRTRSAQKPRRAKRAKRGRKSKSRVGKMIAGAVGAVTAGAALGALSNEAGLLQKVPVQHKTGISLVGWIGIGTTAITALFAKREAGKIIGYGLGGGLITTEVVRQIDMRGYDFRTAFGNAPPLLFDPTPPQALLDQANAQDVDEDAIRNGLKVKQP